MQFLCERDCAKVSGTRSLTILSPGRHDSGIEFGTWRVTRGRPLQPMQPMQGFLDCAQTCKSLSISCRGVSDTIHFAAGRMAGWMDGFEPGGEAQKLRVSDTLMAGDREKERKAERKNRREKKELIISCRRCEGIAMGNQEGIIC